MGGKTAIIIGAGPAGLTAAYELIDKTDIKPIVFEMSHDIGGISKTVEYKGNRIDIGGHRFFSKSERVMQWWQNILPLQGAPSRDDIILDRTVPLSEKAVQQKIKSAQTLELLAPDPEKNDLVMLIRKRISRIYFLRKLFDYPISLTINTINKLGFVRLFKIGVSYIKIQICPIKEEKSLEDFFINRFGKELYQTFFKDYTEKVWGIPCNQIKPEWGAQRVKGLSISKAILHALKNLSGKDASVAQKKTETSLIEQFTYPKFGPGQLWTKVADIVYENGGEIYFGCQVVGLELDGKKIKSVQVRDTASGKIRTYTGDYFFSTMAVKDLIKAIGDVPEEVHNIANGLVYRDMITVGLLLNKLKIKNNSSIKTINRIIPDNWIYIQERDVRLGRVQIYNNWSPYMVKDENTVWLGLEYFCTEGDDLWIKSDDNFSKFAVKELISIGFIEESEVLDSVIIRTPKTYPAYFGSYDQFEVVKEYVNQIDNLFLIGRNGMHRYNNQDHSMLTAMTAVENIINKVASKDNIWAVNAESEYHEEK